MDSSNRNYLQKNLLFDFKYVILLFGIIECITSTFGEESPAPSITSVSSRIREVVEGDDILLTCVVMNLGKNTVFWAKQEGNTKKIITVNKIVLNSDHRFSVLHDEGSNKNSSLISSSGQVWVLAISKVKSSDAGTYICQVNSRPQLLQHFQVVVKPSTEDLLHKEVRSNHNYTECCHLNGITSKCLGFCTIHNILEGTTGAQPEDCEDQFPNIVKCMADYRNHVPCCERQNIPDLCQDLCKGDYTIQDDYVKSHFSCTAYTESTLLCISEGIELLPMPPLTSSAKVLGPREVVVEWEPPKGNSPPVENYVIHVKTLNRFDPPIEVAFTEEFNDTLDIDDDLSYGGSRLQVKVSANQTRATLNKMSPLTWYEIAVTSENRHGSSTPLYHIRILTLPEGDNFTKPIAPDLPDIVQCCVDKNVQHDQCLRRLCDPQQRYIEESDMIVCAPWVSESFSCLADGKDHSPCCKARGLPDLCVELCTGNVTKIDFKYFKCVDYFSDFRSCLMKGYGVLPSAPQEITVSNIHSTFALVSWKPPAENPNSVTSYHGYYRFINASRDCNQNWHQPTDTMITYKGLHATKSPHVLSNLCENTSYEIYFQAFNIHGSSEPSNRIIFKTLAKKSEEKMESTGYNVTTCCMNTNVSPGCMSLCSYNARMSHLRALSTVCRPELSKLLRCAVGGRNHKPCCERRGVPDSCLTLCAGTFTNDIQTPASCMPYIGNIMMCLEEGVDLLPAPIIGLHATAVGNGEITLVWEPPQNSSTVSLYQVHYNNVEPNSVSHALYQFNNTYNTSITAAEINGLKTGGLYDFFVVALNEEGASLPSSIITLNLTEEKKPSGPVAGVPSAPHSLTLDSKTATTLTILWQPPALAHPIDRFSYTIYFKQMKSKYNATEEFNSTTTASTALHLTDLTPNTQYVIYAKATNDMGTSRPSETLLAWTDPAYPAFVEPPTVHPTNMIMEGSTMTVLCIAMGSPPPNVSLYISGVLQHQAVTRHMVTVIKNVTRDMTAIVCYADNGYGPPMQSSIVITITRRPKVTTPAEKVSVTAGQEVVLSCTVDAWPEPSMVWWRDENTRTPVIHGGNIALETIKSSEQEGVTTMSLTIKKTTDANNGSYYCNAQNTLGEFTQTIKLIVNDAMEPLKLDVSECCTKNNVSDACFDACSFEQLDFYRVMNREECVPDFSKLMKCAADGSDHRSCCSHLNVPPGCLEWCRGEPVTRHRDCVFGWAPAIFSCFHEGQETLPGPPGNVKITSLSPTSARVSWNSPTKNPEAVELYRVFWRASGERLANKNDTASRTLVIHDIKEGMDYEVAVKAGNHKGTSILTKTMTFHHSVSTVSSAINTQSRNVGLAFGLFILVVLIVGLVCGVVWWGWRTKKLCAKAAVNGGISFENPSYIREQNGDTVQIAETPNGSMNGSITPSGLNGNLYHNSTQNGNGIWNTQTNTSNPMPGFDEDEPNGKGGYKRFTS